MHLCTMQGGVEKRRWGKALLNDERGGKRFTTGAESFSGHSVFNSNGIDPANSTANDLFTDLDFALNR